VWEIENIFSYLVDVSYETEDGLWNISDHEIAVVAIDQVLINRLRASMDVHACWVRIRTVFGRSSSIIDFAWRFTMQSAAS
jgi:hypothetical protein